MGSGTTAAAEDDLMDDAMAEQGRYLAKYASERRELYETMGPIFDPPEREDFEAEFVESLAPSASSMLPGIAGEAAELLETLEWYGDIIEMSEFADVADQGLLEEFDDSPGRGNGGHAMDEAHGELEELADRADAVTDAAEAFADDPSAERGHALVEALEAERDTLAAVEWIDAWSDVHPPAYDSWRVGDAEEGAELVRDNAEAVLTVLEAADDLLADHLETVREGELFGLPEMVTLYNHNVDDVRANVPDAALDLFAGDTYHFRVQEDGEDLSVYWIETEDSGTIADYSITERDGADADVVVSADTYETIRNADDPVAEASDAYGRDDVTVSGNGFRNRFKYGTADVLGSFVSGAEDALGEN
ncbi:hypothetical protein [Natronobacterium texcoconense]|uniref:hypothetical protein n=1 Tax=Natronobacterium texcoconense TaxID=1095778 RepID=UPI000B84EE10|nr:hypothetical protein [Natronobacterium texcoconense]